MKHRHAHIIFADPGNRDWSWDAHIYEFGERERYEFAALSYSQTAAWRRRNIRKLCLEAGYERGPVTTEAMREARQLSIPWPKVELA